MDIEKFRLMVNENLLTKREAMEITGQQSNSIDQAIHNGRLVPFIKKGTGRGTIRLFLKEDVEKYNEERLEYLKKFGRSDKS